MDKFVKVENVKARSHRSWRNFRNTIYKEMGIDYFFGTKKVENSSISYLNKAQEESGLSIAEILSELDNRGLGL